MSAAYTGNQIAQARKAKGYTQKQLAEQLQVTDKAVSKWERGLGYPDIALLKPLSEALGLSLVQLLCGEETEAEQALEKAAEISIAEKEALKRDLKKRWIQTLITALLIMGTQLGASWLFDQAGMYGLPQILTMGSLTLPGFIAGDAIYTLRQLKRM